MKTPAEKLGTESDFDATFPHLAAELKALGTGDNIESLKRRSAEAEAQALREAADLRPGWERPRLIREPAVRFLHKGSRSRLEVARGREHVRNKRCRRRARLPGRLRHSRALANEVVARVA